MQRCILVGSIIFGLSVGSFIGGVSGYAAVDEPQQISVPIEPTKITVTPTIPTVSEPVQITASGIWSVGCVPYHVAHEVIETTLMITLEAPGPEIPCGQVVTPWSITVDFGLLPANHYQVEVQGAVTVSSTTMVLGNQIYLPVIGG